MWLKSCQYCTDLIFACFLPGALPRPAPDVNFLGFLKIWGPCWYALDVHLGVCGNFFGNVCAVAFLLDFGCRLDFQGGLPATVGVSPGHVFSDIWYQNRRFRVRMVALAGFWGYLLR